MSSKASPVNYESYRPKLGWLPLEIVKCTFGATTQLANSIPIHYPFHEHYKSWTPALNRRRLQEKFATDTLFASTPALGGITCAQIYTGLTSHYTAVYGMTSESQGPETLEDFV
jgi:hypothetical protein